MTNTSTSNTGLQNGLSLLGRLMLAFLFLPAGVGKLLGFAGTVGYINSKGLPMPEVGAAIALTVEILGGLALIAGFQTRIASVVLAVFTVGAAVFFHNYWAVPEAQQMMQQINFNKNIAIAGGLLVLAAFGAGGFSVDAKRRA
ncbi:DoxX family protein [Xylophilus sp. GW821-FHT01B05]